MTCRSLIYLPLALLLFATAGCSTLLARLSDPASHSNPNGIETIALDRLKPADLPEEIERLEKATSSSDTPVLENVENQHRLALLYLLPANPNRDLNKGARALKNYVEQLPEGMAKLENGLWLQLLQDQILLDKKFNELEETSGRNTTSLEREKQQLTQRIQDLTNSNAKLKQDMEKLKMIDLSVEKKRKSYR